MRKACLIFLLSLLAIMPAAFAECRAGNASMLAPAVLGEKGQMLSISVETRPGDGQIYMAAKPYIGVSTQNSQRIAASIASKLLGQNESECDFIVRMGGAGDAESIDGPSAGAALTILAFSSLSGAPILHGLAVTGTIEPDGSIGTVGGVSAKATAAAEEGYTVFLTPKLTMYERLMLDGVQKKWNITVVETTNIRRAVEIAFSNETPEETEITYIGTVVPAGLGESSIPSGPQYSRFEKIARETVAEAGAAVEESLAKGNGEFDWYFRNEMNVSQDLLSRGYAYSAANLAFLTQIDASILGKKGTTEEVAIARAEVADCMDKAVRPAPTYGNYEEIFGGDVRMAWAKLKMEEADAIDVEGEDSAVYVMHELEFVKGWCTLARRMYSAPASGGEINESRLEKLAWEKIKEAREDVSVDNYDANWHLASAEEAYNAGRYGAALYDAAYSHGAAISENELAASTVQQISEKVRRIGSYNVSGMWPNLYKSQAEYYVAGDDGSMSTAFRLATFVDELAGTQVEIVSELADGQIAPDATRGRGVAATGSEALTGLVTLAAIGALLVLAYEAYAIVRRK